MRLCKVGVPPAASPSNAGQVQIQSSAKPLVPYPVGISVQPQSHDYRRSRFAEEGDGAGRPAMTPHPIREMHSPPQVSFATTYSGQQVLLWSIVRQSCTCSNSPSQSYAMQPYYTVLVLTYISFTSLLTTLESNSFLLTKLVCAGSCARTCS